MRSPYRTRYPETTWQRDLSNMVFTWAMDIEVVVGQISNGYSYPAAICYSHMTAVHVMALEANDAMYKRGMKWPNYDV